MPKGGEAGNDTGRRAVGDIRRKCFVQSFSRKIKYKRSIHVCRWAWICGDAVIFAVAHDVFKKMDMERVDRLYGRGKKILLDLKGIFDRREYEENAYQYWRL